MDAFTPRQTTELVCRMGAKKRDTPIDKLFVSSLMSGPLLGFGTVLYLNTVSNPWLLTNAPGLNRTIGGAVFPIALVMVALSGSDLITTSFMFMTVAYLQRRVSTYDVLKCWTITFLGNLAGSLFFVIILICYAGVFDAEPYKSTVLEMATAHAVTPKWHQIFLRAIGGCWLVCFSIFTSISAREVSSKVIAIWFPTLTFDALSLNHVIADVTFFSLAIWLGHPKVTVGYYIWKVLIPTLIGNLVGGCVFVGAVYWYLYLTGDMGGHVDFSVGAERSALQEGVEMRPSHHGEGGTVEDAVWSSSIGQELSFEKYGKPRAKHAPASDNSQPAAA